MKAVILFLNNLNLKEALITAHFIQYFFFIAGSKTENAAETSFLHFMVRNLVYFHKYVCLQWTIITEYCFVWNWVLGLIFFDNGCSE